jgi:hypothetical protein
MPQNSITPEQKAQAVNLGGMMAHVQAVMQRFNSEVVAAGLAGKVDNATVTALTSRVSDIEALIGSATTPDADNIINKVREMIDFFADITEEKTLAGLLSTLKTELEAEIPSTMAWDSITGKPPTYPAAAHNHDDRYYQKSQTYTKSEVDDAIQEALINPISDSSITVASTFKKRDLVSVDGTMYLCDAQSTNQLPKRKAVVSGGSIVLSGGRVVITDGGTLSPDWHAI